MHGLLRDVRYGFRSLSRSLSLAVFATLALTFGIGLTTTMFSIVYSALMSDPPYPDGKSFVSIQRMRPSSSPEPWPLTVHDFADYRAQQRSFTDIGGFTTGTVYVSGDEKAERFDGAWVTASSFDIIGVPPALGRTFRNHEDVAGAAKVVVLAHDTWRDRYNSNPAVIGTTARVNGQPHTIIGVMPASFKFIRRAQLWLPLVIDPVATSRGQGQMIWAFGRLKPGVSIERATSDLTVIARRIAAEHKETNEGFIGYAAKFTDAYVAPPPKRMLRVMLGAVFVVLLIACTNVANLLLDHAVHRSREVGVRIALGASRVAIVRQFLAESLVLSAVAMVVGLVIAFVGVRMFRDAVGATDPPFWMDFRLHPAVFAFTAVVTLLTTLIAGAIPAYQSSRTDINEVLKDESRGASSFRIGRISNGLVMFEIALSCALLVAAGLMVKSVVKVNTLDPGYSTKNVFTARIGFPEFYTDTIAEWSFFDQLLERVSGLPGVQSAALTSGLPATRAGFNRSRFALEGQSYQKPDDQPVTRTAAITADFFTTINAPLVAGRAFDANDRAGSLAVAIVSRSFAAQYFPKTEAVGKRVRLGDAARPGRSVTIVGVVGDMFDGDQRNATPPILFQPLAQARTTFVSIVARTNGGPMTITQGVRDVVKSLNPDIPVYWAQSFDEATGQAMWFINVFGTLFMIFGVVALFLAAVGLYAVMSFSVSRRTRELGIRMALGATAQNVVRMTFTHGMLRLAVGMTFGMLFAFGVSRLLRFLLFQVQPSDPGVFGAVVATLVIVGIVACLIPSRRATRVDPMVALRRE